MLRREEKLSSRFVGEAPQVVLPIHGEVAPEAPQVVLPIHGEVAPEAPEGRGIIGLS